MWTLRAHFNYATALQEAGRTDYLGKVFMREGNLTQAVLQFEEALRVHPDFPDAAENLRIAKQSENTNQHE